MCTSLTLYYVQPLIDTRILPSSALRVGPESAGAVPGPACYGHGGREPTVTDANVVLGYLPSALLGGEFKVRRASDVISACLFLLPVLTIT